MIKSPYDYRELSRQEHNGTRKYLTPDGDRLPSVTTVLDKTKDKSHLIEWRKRVGEQRAKEISTEASGVGTRMHKFLEDYVITDSWPQPGSNPYSVKANQMAQLIRDHALVDIDEFWGLEVQLYNPSLYAGTTDVVAVYRGNPSICDYKQTNRPKKPEWVDDYRLQLVAYAECHNAMYDTNIREGHIFMCSRDLEYQQFDVWPDEYDHWRNAWYDRLYDYYANHA